MRFIRILFSLLLIYGLVPVQAQLVPLNLNFTNEVNSLAAADSQLFTTVKPLLPHQLQPIEKGQQPLLEGLGNTTKKWVNFKERLLNGHFLGVTQKEVYLFADPVLTLQGGGSNRRDGLTYQSTRGINVGGTIGEKFSFGSAFFESQARFPNWVDSAVRRNDRVVPGRGMGRAFGRGGFDFSRSDAYLAYTPSAHFNAVLGYGKNFIGDGYRSLLLSDNAYNYPYLRLNNSFWRIHYTVLYNQYTNVKQQFGGRYQPKYATLHYLNIRVGKKWQLGFFENVLWQGRDSTGHRGFDLQYLNPLLLMRPVEFSIGSPDNALFGFTAKYRLKKGFLYAQAMLDDFNFGQTKKHRQQHLNNKYGLQVGFWQKDLFNLAGLNYGVEYNTVRPYSYGHRKVAQNYTHYSQALAHPLGANFHELVNRFTYTYQRWYGSLHSTLALKGEDKEGAAFGGNLWGGESGVPLLGSTTLQGDRTKLVYGELRTGYLLNPATKMGLELQVGHRRREGSSGVQGETFFSIGLRTNIANTYHDF